MKKIYNLLIINKIIFDYYIFIRTNHDATSKQMKLKNKTEIKLK